MIDPHFFLHVLQAKGIDFFTGVPDSQLKELCSTLLCKLPPEKHVIAANEGNALGLAMGHYLATSRPAVVYMQNSGLGNIINPLASLADREVYAIPALLLIGWRGQPGKKDEPQHVKQGRISPALLETLEVPYRIMDGDEDPAAIVDAVWEEMHRVSMPAAILIKAGAFSKGEKPMPPLLENAPTMQREAAIATILDLLEKKDCLLATTGKTGRELFELRVARAEAQQDFLSVGGMGHCSSIALGAALAMPDRRFVCLDGDGALILHMGAMGLAGNLRPPNFIHVVCNNFCHESVGGQPTCAGTMDFVSIAKACGYASQHRARSPEDISRVFSSIAASPGPHFVELILAKGSRANLGRPTSSPMQNKLQFMKHLGTLS